MLYISAIANETSYWKEQLNYCNKTWAININANDKLYFILGKHKNKMFIEDYDDFFNIKKNIIENKIYYDVVDSFYPSEKDKLLIKHNLNFNATYKTLLDMNNFLKTNLIYYIRTHTGSYINLKLLNKFCRNIPKNNLYCGKIFNKDREFKKYKFCAGSCFILSRDIVEKICSDIKFVLNEYKNQPLIDDVFFGNLIINYYKITPMSSKIIFIKDINNFVFNKNIYHYYFKNKQKCIQENWYRIIHEKY